jgi:hypothetical protein
MGPQTWSVEHFSVANPAGPGQDDIPALLRRVADTLSSMGPVDVQDVVFHAEVTEDGDWPSVTVYLHRETVPDADPDAPGHRRGLRSVPGGG